MEGRAARGLSRASSRKEHIWHLPDGRTLRVVTTPNPEGGVTYLFDDVTERLDLVRRYDELIRVQGETLDNLAEAVAVFGSDGRLRLHNPAFAACGGWRRRTSSRAAAHRDRDRLVPAAPRRRRDLAGAARRGHGDREPRGDLRTARAARRQRGRLHHGAAAGRRHAGDVPRRRPTRSTSSARCASATRRSRTPTRSRSISSITCPTSCARRSPTSSASPTCSASRRPVRWRRSSANISATSPSRPTRCSRSSTTSSISPPSTPARMKLNLGPVDIRHTMEAAAEGVQDRLRRGRPSARHRERRRTSAASPPTSAACGRCCSTCWPTRSASRRRAAPSRCAPSGAPTRVVFSVTDHGPGIPPEVQDRVFDWFETHSLGSHHRGAGLGLSIVRSFVELHGGTVRSPPSSGKAPP